MPLFRLQVEGDDMSNAELVIAQETNLKLESYLESWLENSPGALAQDELILWIGRQTSAATEAGTIFPDLLGVDSEGNLVIVELKRDRAPRDVVAQLLEYAAWANELSEAQVHEMAEGYFQTRDEFQGRNFLDVFNDIFDPDEVPALNRSLRLFIVAEEISPRVSRVCRFLRTAHEMDISCIAVSTFQTESGEVLVNTEAKVGDGNIGAPKAQRRLASHISQWSGDKSVREVVLESVQELTGGDTNVEFTPKEVRALVLKKYPGFNEGTVGAQLYMGTQLYMGAYPYKYYWRVEKGKYRLLHDSERDNVHTDR